MAAAMIGGAFLGAFLNVVLDKLASPQVVNLIRGKKLDPKLLQRLETTLKVVGAVLNDAEKKQISGSNINGWLDDLKDAVYMADDFLDEVSTKAATKKQVSNPLSRLFNVQDRKMVSNLEDIVVKLESLLKLKESLDLKEIAIVESFTLSTSLGDGFDIYGRDKDKAAIIKLLLDNNGDGEDISVIPIVGMAGVGKTTLAQLVYSDDNLKQTFEFKAWVCVSEEFGIIRVIKTILEAVTKKTCEMSDFNLLHLELENKFKGRKFLMVLDDVWIDDYHSWNLLRKAFEGGKEGSKILVTTRSAKVASVAQTLQTYHLNQLSNEDCWLVFAKHACLPSVSSANTTTTKSLIPLSANSLDPKKIGMKIVKKCKGLPLAAQSLGGLLRSKNDIRDWEKILNSDFWEFSETENRIIPALKISYHYLPPPLKRCFVYCSLFPKDYEFQKNELVLLWMAEDLLPPPMSGMTSKDVGYECFDYLVSRSFFQHSRTRNNSFLMHDLMHDLATFFGGEFYCRLEDDGKENKISSKTRHLSFIKFSDPVLENVDIFGKVKYMRTFLPINSKADPFHCEMKLSFIMQKLKYLRVLSFSRFPNLDVLPKSIGELIHLRYLDLSETSIMILPESLCNLYNLQTLKLFGCKRLTVLPSGFHKLVNLQYLSFGVTPLKEMPKKMGKLKHLQHLSYFLVGKHEGNRIRELGELSKLRGSLWIWKLENVTCGSEALEARMMDKHFDNLYLRWSGDDCADFQIETDILCKLQPYQDLKLLSIKGYRGTRFPDWVGSSSYHYITDITLFSCKNCCVLPSLGQLPSLKVLIISKFNGLETIDSSFYRSGDSSSVTPFPSLESLKFYNMPCWEGWESFESNAFLQLEQLTIKDCPRLRGDLPNHLPSLRTLTIERCEQLAYSPIGDTSMRKSTLAGVTSFDEI